MPPNLQGVLIALAVTIGLYILSPFSASRSQPATSNRPYFSQRLVAVGDLHGDIHNARKVLRMAGVIDQDFNWRADTDILVQTGDIVDRGAYARDIYQLMWKLRGQASAAGGRVISILGNHEIMNAIGDWRYVTQDDITRFGSTQVRQQELSSEGWLGQEWLANYSTTALVSLGPHASSPKLSFTHGSLRPSYANLLPYPKAINALGQSLLRKALKLPLAAPYPPNPYPGLPHDATVEEIDLYAAGGPYWWRGLAEVEDEKMVCGWAEDLKQRLGVERIIGGHTPNFDRIVHRCNGSVIIIDTGISSAYGGVLSALEIVYTLTPKSDHRAEPFRPLYREREEVHAIYEHRRDEISVVERDVTL